MLEAAKMHTSYQVLRCGWAGLMFLHLSSRLPHGSAWRTELPIYALARIGIT